MSELKHEIVIVPLSKEDGGGFLAAVPDLVGCMADGETPEEALSEVKDAIATWIATYKEKGRELPKPGAARVDAEEYDENLSELVDDQQQLIEKQNELIESLLARVKNLEEARITIDQSNSRNWLSIHSSNTRGVKVSNLPNVVRRGSGVTKLKVTG